MQKNIYFIRHGTAIHNNLYKDIGYKAYSKFRDTSLTYEGFIEADKLSKKWADIHKIDLVLVSPLTRTIQTCLTIFSENKNYCNKIIALDCLLEYKQGGNEICNYRLPKSILKKIYPNINFYIEDMFTPMKF